ncbi:MAG: tetratricopeptide repeat protein [Candidatus Aminicenantes bacterium]|nr:tetratricopeptide repeat protein [Candidatus Aminicenantes bacterium]
MKGYKRPIIAALIFAFVPCLFLFSQSDDASNILAKNQEGVIAFVVIGKEDNEIAKGTGFLIGQEVMLTGYNLISQAEKAEGRDFKGKKVKMEGIWSVDKEHNIALVKVNRKSPQLTMGDPFAAGIGNKIFAVGGNETGQIQVMEGTLEKVTEYAPNKRIFETSLATGETFSGAPVLNSEGKVIGILLQLDLQTKIVLPITYVQGMSKKSSPVKFKDRQAEDYFETYEGAYLAARIFTAIDRNTQAEKHLKKVLNIKPDELDAHLLLSAIYLNQRNYSSAVTTLKKIIELKPDLASAYSGLGEVYIKMRKWGEALAPLQKAAELNQEYKEAYFLMGTAYQELKAFEKAIEAYDNYLGRNPDKKGEAYYQLGLCQMELSQFDRASASLAKANTENPGDSQILNKLAEAYQKSDQYDNAAQTYMKLAEVRPSDSKYYYNTIVRMYDDAGQTDMAISTIKKMIEVNPQDADAIYNLGYMYIKLEKWPEAADVFRQAIEVKPDFIYAYSNLGFSLTKMKKFNDAIEAYKKLVEVDPQNADGWMSIGINYMQIKKFSPAVKPLQKAIELRPDNGVAYYNLAIAFLNLQDQYSAREVYKQLQNVDPTLAQKLSQYLK